MAKILITGSRGQVGSSLVEQLTDKAEFLAVTREELDITDKVAVFNIIKTFKPNVIVNAAGYTAVDRAEIEIQLAQKININGPKYLAEAANLVNAAILHISTDYVFDGKGSREYKETDFPSPQSVYGRSKLAGEIAVFQQCKKSIVLRTAWGFGEYGNNFVKTMLQLAKNHTSLSIVGDQFGGPTYTGDIATALIMIANKIISGEAVEYGVYHYSGKPYVSWFEYAQAIFQQAEQQGIIDKQPILNNITTADYPTPAKRPANSCLNLNKIDRTFGIKPSDWQKALKNIKAYG